MSVVAVLGKRWHQSPGPVGQLSSTLSFQRVGWRENAD